MTGLSDAALAAIDEAARRKVAEAPPPKQWQIDGLRVIFRDYAQRLRDRDGRAA
jgi:hypothetical protein